MTDRRRLEALTRLVSMLCAAHSREADEATFAAYEVGLEGVPLDAVQRAVQRSLQEDTYRMPPPARLRELAGVGRRQAVAGTAWGEVLEMIRGRKPKPDKVRESVVAQLGGYDRLGLAEREKLHAYVRRDFEARYVELWLILEENPHALDEGAAHLRGLLSVGSGNQLALTTGRDERSE